MHEPPDQALTEREVDALLEQFQRECARDAEDYSELREQLREELRAKLLSSVAPVARPAADGPPQENDFVAYVTRQSISRANRWHDDDFRQWSGLEWAGAMCGEAGEAANVAKKLRRLELAIDGNAKSERPLDGDALRGQLGRECADVFLYLVLLAARYEIDLTTAIVETFNVKSVEMGFPERIAIRPAPAADGGGPDDEPMRGDWICDQCGFVQSNRHYIPVANLSRQRVDWLVCQHDDPRAESSCPNRRNRAWLQNYSTAPDAFRLSAREAGC